MGRINGFSVSKQYTDAINKILNTLPTNTKSRFICQAIVEKAQRTKSLKRFGYVSFEEENDIEEVEQSKVSDDTKKEVVQETPVVEESESDKLLKLLTTEELERHAEEIKPFKNKPNILEVIIGDIIKKRSNDKESSSKVNKEEDKLRDEALAKLNSF